MSEEVNLAMSGQILFLLPCSQNFKIFRMALGVWKPLDYGTFEVALQQNMHSEHGIPALVNERLM